MIERRRPIKALIDGCLDAMVAASDSNDRRAFWFAAAAAIRNRPPEEIERMERERGLR